VIGVLETAEADLGPAIYISLPIGELVVPDWDVDPSCELCRKVFLIVPGRGVPIFVLEPNRPMRRGGLNDMAIGDTIWGWHTGICLASLPGQCYATRIVVVKPESDL
jgi:hypothetical protein